MLPGGTKTEEIDDEESRRKSTLIELESVPHISIEMDPNPVITIDEADENNPELESDDIQAYETCCCFIFIDSNHSEDDYQSTIASATSTSDIPIAKNTPRWLLGVQRVKTGLLSVAAFNKNKDRPPHMRRRSSILKAFRLAGISSLSPAGSMEHIPVPELVTLEEDEEEGKLNDSQNSSKGAFSNSRRSSGKISPESTKSVQSKASSDIKRQQSGPTPPPTFDDP